VGHPLEVDANDDVIGAEFLLVSLEVFDPVVGITDDEPPLDEVFGVVVTVNDVVCQVPVLGGLVSLALVLGLVPGDEVLVGQFSPTSSIMILLAGAALFSWVMSVEGVSDLLAEFMFSISTDPVVLLLLANIYLLILGMIIDPLASIFMAVPIVVPPLVAVGVNPVHIGIIMVFNLMLGLLTPHSGSRCSSPRTSRRSRPPTSSGSSRCTTGYFS
jgi:hypothetical protein